MKRKKGHSSPRHRNRYVLHPGEGYVTCPIEKARIIREFIDWLTHEQENVVGVRHGTVFYAPRSIRGTEDSPIAEWVHKNSLRRKRRV